MKLLRFVGSTLALLLLTACTAVYVEEPIGGAPLVLDPEAWEGTWLLSEMAVVAEVIDQEEGLLRFAWVEKDFGGRLGLETAVFQFREGDGWIFATMLEYGSDEAESSGYPWGIAMQGDEQLLILLPDVEKFRALVEAGTLPGRLDDDEDVHLGPLDANHLARILSDEHAFLFNLDEFGAATRISR